MPTHYPQIRHRTVIDNSTQVIYRIHTRRDNVRFWFNAGGELVGIWQGRNGRTYAVGHNQAGRTIVFPAFAPADKWARGSGLGVNP